MWWAYVPFCETIHDFEGSVYETVGIVPANCMMQQNCKRLAMLRLLPKEILY